MKQDQEATLAVLKDATQAIREDYVARYTEMMMVVLKRDRAGLEAVGMDAQQYAPYPSGNMSRADYRKAEFKYRRVRSSFRGVKSCRSMREPEIVVEREDAEPRVREAARQAADAEIDSYLYKMTGKIGKLATKATTNGRIWDSATMIVECADGETQTWSTRCIINCSCLGKVFNQWPTRRIV